MHVLRIRYDLSTEKLLYTAVTLCYDTLPFLTHTVYGNVLLSCINGQNIEVGLLGHMTILIVVRIF